MQGLIHDRWQVQCSAVQSSPVATRGSPLGDHLVSGGCTLGYAAMLRNTAFSLKTGHQPNQVLTVKTLGTLFRFPADASASGFSAAVDRSERFKTGRMGHRAQPESPSVSSSMESSVLWPSRKGEMVWGPSVAWGSRISVAFGSGSPSNLHSNKFFENIGDQFRVVLFT